MWKTVAIVDGLTAAAIAITGYACSPREDRARIVAEARAHQVDREKTYRERALAIYPHVCGRCGREFAGKRLRELTVHHRDHNHDNNPPDGSNWELLCLYCHDAEHDDPYARGHYNKDPLARDPETALGFEAFEGLKDMLDTADLDRDMNRLFGIINAMTPDERRNPTRVIDQSRRRRIARGAGVEPQEVNDLVKQFDGMASMMKGMAGLGMRERMQQVQKIQSQLTNPAGRLAVPKGDTGKRLTADQRRKMKKQREKEARRRKRGS